MTRLSIASEDVLGENYTITNIIASNYNPTIDTDITVTITVTDVYGDEVANKYVTTTCNIGKFTKLNGQTISDTQSVTAQTDNDGEISLTYTCSEWGLITFSANNTNNQINVIGSKTLYNNNGLIIKKRPTGMITASLSRSFAVGANATVNILPEGTLSTNDCPNAMVTIKLSNNYRVSVSNGGRIDYINDTSTSSSSANRQFYIVWASRDM